MSETLVLREEKVPLKSKIWVSIADASCAMLNTFVVSIGLTYYFTSFRGMDARFATTAWMIFAIWNAVNDPLFGYISDRTKSGLGRRIPYIRFGAPIIGISFVLCWINFGGIHASQTVMFIQMIALLFIFDTLYTAIATSIYVMPFEMAVSNKARSGIFIWKLVFSIFPLAVPLVLWGFIKPEPGSDPLSFQWIMLAFGLVMAALIFFSTFFYKEMHFQQEEKQLPFLKSLKECFANRSFIVFEVISFTIIYVQTSLMLGLNYYLAEFSIPAVPLYAALAVGIIGGVFLFVNVRERWGVKGCTMVMAAVFSIGCFMVLGLGHQLIPTTIGLFCFGIGFAGGMYLIPLMNGDVVDMDEHRTGLRREGMYAGVNSFITKPAISFANSLFIWFLTRNHYNFSASAGSQSAEAEAGILLGWVLVPGILLAVSFFSLFLYPLTGKKWEEIKKQLTALHIEKEKNLLVAKGIRYEE
ncbi:MAG: MFS transporter [Chloroflexi bacterium]|nr:MFS transporter [Chloroflexota bacterium]